jgi:alkylation response protein AidB-like acyl-CoA dehydrogenase
MTAGLVRQWLESGRLDLPLPAAGQTVERWQRLADLTESDIVAGRLAEAHADAVAILAELGGPAPRAGELWAVWAAEAPDAVLTASTRGEAVALSGTKAWCSGAGLCTNALVTARLEDGKRGLFAVRTAGSAVPVTI